MSSHLPLSKITSLIALLVTCTKANPSAQITHRYGPQCHDISIPVDVSTLVRQFPPHLNLTTYNWSSIPELPSTQLHSNYSIAATYCEPAIKVPQYADTLQILIHGAMYTRTYFSGLSHAPGHDRCRRRYSYIDNASTRGYATLSIDRLCNGLSSHPSDPLSCQLESQLATLHTLITRAKTGSLPNQRRRFRTIHLIGHSLGSALIQAYITAHPNEVHTIVLTGFAPKLIDTLSAVGDPGREYSMFPDSAYSVFLRSFYYNGTFDHSVAEYDFLHRGTFNRYEIATVAFGLRAAEEFHGNAIVLNGAEDVSACLGNCRMEGIESEVRGWYPRAERVVWRMVEETGHCVDLHYTAGEAFDVIFKELGRIDRWEKDC